MREILFRGQRVDNGEWIYGDIQHNVDCKKIREQEIGKEPDYVTNQNIKQGGKIAKSFAVIPETVGQYTGLTDKNGVKIFEGDICEFTNSDGECTRYVVQWDNGDSEICDGAGWYVFESEGLCGTFTRRLLADAGLSKKQWLFTLLCAETKTKGD